jgi:enoyl-CoA hydratase/carnithine racemase
MQYYAVIPSGAVLNVRNRTRGVPDRRDGPRSFNLIVCLRQQEEDFSLDYETILFDVGTDHVATITLNRPDKLNGFNDAMCEEFVDAWARVRDTDSIHAVVLRSQGRAFSVGVESAGGLEMLSYENVWRQIDPGEKLGPKSNNVWKPVVMAVNGFLASGAFYWLNEADIVICANDAQFFDGHVSFGMVAALEPIGLMRRIQLGEVLRIALMGTDERVTAETALRIGLVSEITAPASLHERAQEIAAGIALKPTAATQGTLRAIWDSLDCGRRAALAAGQRYWQVGNSLGAAQLDRTAPKRTWRGR